MPETTMGLDEFIALAGNPALHLGDELSAEDMMRRLQDQQAVCVELREWLNRLG